LEIYQGKWQVFVKFCRDRELDPLLATAPLIADFLLDIFNKGRTPSTIIVYRTAIAGALKLTQGVDYGSDPQLSSLIRNFQRERPRTALRTPGWDLAFVLFSLTQPPFEPLSAEDMPLKLLTLKTVFLVMLASGARRGEVHALSSSGVSRDPSWRWITLKPVPEFLSKTGMRSGGTTFDGVTIQGLAPFVGRDLEDDRKLCPVRALKTYLARTQNLRRKGSRRLFISFKPGKSGDICKNTISSWVVQLIKLVYDLNNDKARTLSGVRAHDVRGLAASWAARGTYSIDQLLQACSWSSHTTFTSFYLKDMSAIKDDLLTLGPISVAQTVVNPRHVH